MATPTLPELDPTLVGAWAAETLGLNPQAAPAEIRAALLQRLPDEDFLPPSQWQSALPLVRGRMPADARTLLPEVVEKRLREEVEEFAAEFFSLAPVERRRRLEDLATSCAFLPPLSARLDRLRAGIDVPAVDSEETDPFVRELAGHIRALFVMRPTAAAAERRKLLLSWRDKLRSWEKAASSLRKKYPQLAALEQPFVRQLEGERKRQAILAKKKRARRVSGWIKAHFNSFVIILLIAIGVLVGIAIDNENSKWGDGKKGPDFPKLQEFKKRIEENPTLNELLEKKNKTDSEKDLLQKKIMEFIEENRRHPNLGDRNPNLDKKGPDLPKKGPPPQPGGNSRPVVPGSGAHPPSPLPQPPPSAGRPPQ